MDRVAIVILNYNGKRYLEQFLPPLLAHSQGHRIVIADNHSSDGSLAFLAAHYPALDLIRLDDNYGFSGGYNRALRQIEAEYYVLLNSDVEVSPQWVEPLLDFMDQHPEVAACQPKIKSFQQRQFFDYAGAAGGYLDKYGYPFCRGRVFNHIEEDQGQYDDCQEVFWASGACLFIRGDLYHQVGGLDEVYFAHMEEIGSLLAPAKVGYPYLL
ncbi:MAG: glycosyltransferase family 2 protein, partial [Bacteroidia bacterium]|nr:glycosyltransferase family 2 protein [Bacteroidia bacterium]